MEIDRRILVFDGPRGELRRLALDLVGLKFDVHYANDIDEARMVAREAKGRINVVLFTATSDLPPIHDLARRFGVSPAALVPVGPRPDDRVVAALKFHDVRWHLWGEPSEQSICFVLSSVLFEQDPLEIRFHRRVPANIPARIEINGAKADTAIRDISLGGACLIGGLVGTASAQGSLCFSSAEEEIKLPIRIAWSVDGNKENPGVAGVSFLEVAPAEGKLIDVLLESVIARHRIEKPIHIAGDSPSAILGDRPGQS